VGKDVHLATGTLVLFLISFANLCPVVWAVLYRGSQPAPPPEQLPRGTRWFGSLALGLAFSSQILYVAFSAAWFFRWRQFYPGNPMQNFVTLGGLALSAGAFVTALLGTGLKRCAGVLSSVITGGLWLLSSVASVAV
jgi:hypothetical protein